METYIALLRGINVGGNNRLPMKELVSILEAMGGKNVRTYIQSGNAVFQSGSKNSERLSVQLSAEINKKFGFEPDVLLLERAELDRAITENPFPEAMSDPASLHLGFLAARPVNPDLTKLNSIKKMSERFHLAERVFYLHAPEGVGRSKLAAGAEKILGVPMTDRNWKSVCSIGAIANG